MDLREMNELLRNIDQRTQRIEQMLPSLPSREEMHAAFQTGFARLPTREEMHAAIQAAVAPLATMAEVREEGERTRRHFDIIAERLQDDIRLVAENQVRSQQQMDAMRRELKQDIARLDRRLTRLEASR